MPEENQFSSQVPANNNPIPVTQVTDNANKSKGMLRIILIILNSLSILITGFILLESILTTGNYGDYDYFGIVASINEGFVIGSKLALIVFASSLTLILFGWSFITKQKWLKYVFILLLIIGWLLFFYPTYQFVSAF